MSRLEQQSFPLKGPTHEFNFETPSLGDYDITVKTFQCEGVEPEEHDVSGRSFFEGLFDRVKNGTIFPWNSS